ncbi:MAG: GtrA family protein [Syntrophobacteraceae bacterium]|nr:GtrA family protein [Desulfobacteraceae bacterium]
MRAVIVIPVLDDCEHIGAIIEALQVQFNRMNHDMQILVVEDESSGGASDSVREKQRIYANVHMVPGRRNGPGPARIHGMQYASGRLGADAVFEMNADFSHKPEDVPRLMAALEEGADLVVGSRYVKGGRVPGEWGICRRMISRFANFAARWIAGLYGVKDCTAGFRTVRKTVIDRIDWKTLSAIQGHAFPAALLKQAVANGAVVREIPVGCLSRPGGEPKVGFSDIVKFLFDLGRIRLHGSITLLKFLAVGISGIVVNLAFFSLFLWSGLHKYLASPLAIELSVLWNFWLHNSWTFTSRDVAGSIPVKCLKFNLVSLGALAVSYSSFVALTILFPGVSPQIHQLIGIAPGTLVNYLVNSTWTFASRRSIIDRPAGPEAPCGLSPQPTAMTVAGHQEGEFSVHLGENAPAVPCTERVRP